MSFVRPEALATIRRWAEPVVIGALAVFLLWSGLDRAAHGDWFGIAMLAIGAVVAMGAIAAAVRSAAAARGRGGPGVVTVEEGRISYFGPEGGGIVAIDALVSVDIVTTDRGPVEEDLYWELVDESGQRVVIPGGAVDATRLFDAIGVLGGLSYQAVIEAMRSTRNRRFAVWRRRPDPRLTRT